jgi:hypothetical protein
MVFKKNIHRIRIDSKADNFLLRIEYFLCSILNFLYLMIIIGHFVKGSESS